MTNSAVPMDSSDNYMVYRHDETIILDMTSQLLYGSCTRMREREENK